MGNEIVLTAQIIGTLTYIGIVIGIYRLIVKNKNSVIEMLKERISAQDEKIRDLEARTADLLTDALEARVDKLTRELARLKEDGEANAQLIQEKEQEREQLKQQLENLFKILEDSELLCPKCGAPVVERGSYPISDKVYGDYVVYECGLSLRDGYERYPCSREKDEAQHR